MSKYISVIMLGIFFIIIISATVSYADDAPARTEDGRGVILRDDGTWEFTDTIEDGRDLILHNDGIWVGMCIQRKTVLKWNGYY